MSKHSEETLAGKCNHEDSRLSCIECSKPICTNCMVQCPVGFRCKSCVGSVNNPLKGSDKKQFYRTLAMCIGIGCGSGWLMPFINVPFISCIICFFLGLFIGRWLAKQIDYSLVPNVAKTIVCGLLIGMCLSPLGLFPFLAIELLKAAVMSGGASLFAGLTAIVGMIFSPVCFIAGILRPTVWGEHW